MKIISVKSRQGNYSVIVGARLLERTGALLKRNRIAGKICIVTQPAPAKYHLERVTTSLRKHKIPFYVHMLPDGETAKSGTELFRLYHALVSKDFERSDAILAVGGGVAGDLAGFAASSYLRGIAFINAATTLLAQVDSAIGGKTGINLEEGKNLVGAFYPPRLVLSDANTLQTLPGRELQAALGEVVKYGMIKDARLFHDLEKSSPAILKKSSRLLERIVSASASIKAGVVSRDEFETRGERMMLNFGHTFGHGFEQALQYRKLMHGEAVAVGMVCASRLAVRLKIFSREECLRMVHLLNAFHLPTSAGGLDITVDSVVSAMGRDKKKKGGKLCFVLPVRIGKVIVRDDIRESDVREVISEVGGKV